MKMFNANLILLPAIACLLPLSARAQTHAVEKPESVVRAIAVYEWTGERDKPSASRIIPVSIFVDGRLRDAGIYLARPVPLALDTGTIFEVEHAGEPQGTLELAFARSLATPSDQENDDGWFGYGFFKPKSKPLPMKASSGPITPVTVSGGKGPHFGSTPPPSTRPDTQPQKPDQKPNQKQDRSDAASGSVVTDPGDQADVDPDSAKGNPDRPTLRRRTPEQRKEAQKKSGQAAVIAVGSLNDDPDRPVLHRGREKSPEEELTPLLGIPPGMQRAVAVSDAQDRPSHDFHLLWDSDSDRAQVLSQMQNLARARLEEYLRHDLPSSPAASAAAPPAKSATHTSKPAPRTAASRRASTHRPTAPRKAEMLIALQDEALSAFTLSYGGDATFVYTASSEGRNKETLYVTVVAQRQPGGELKVAMITATDSAHLDRTPRFLLVDAVDAKASNRASLLFELRAENTRQFALYRVLGAQAEQTFATDNIPNGAAARGSTLLHRSVTP